jgi:hypothetical protein
MRLQKIVLLTSICTATLATSNLYAAQTPPTPALSIREVFDIKDMIVNNINSLFPFQTQVNIGKLAKDDQGDIIASDILIISSGAKNPNISINKLILKGLSLNKQVKNDFSIKVEGLSVTNLASSIANSNLVNAKVDPKDLAHNDGLYSIMMNTISQGIYDAELDYDYSESSVEFKLDSTINKKHFLKEYIELANVDSSDVKVDVDFLASLKNSFMQANIKQVDFDAKLSEVIQDVTTQYLGKKYKQTPDIDIKGDLGKLPGQFLMDVDASLDSKNYFKYNIEIDGINLKDVTLQDIFDGSDKILKNAYIKSNFADTKLNLDFNENAFPQKSSFRQMFSILGEKDIKLAIDSSQSFKDSNYNANMHVKADNLAAMSISSKAKVDGKLSLLPYMGVKASEQNDLYGCTNQLCLTNMDFSFANYGLLEKIARYTNKDPNTTPQQILGSYGALLQLFAVQQKDKFLQQMLSSFAMFLQNPKNIHIKVQANRPVNEAALLNMFINDAKTLKRNNPIKSNGRIDVENKPNIKLINDIQNIFKITFDVNR